MESEKITIARYSKVQMEFVDVSGVVEQAEYTLVDSKHADLKSALLDENTLLARALIGHQAGEVIPYTVGDLNEVRILSVETVDAESSLGAAEKRRETVRKAAAQSELINQLNFATASGSKWGDYDVDVEKLMDQRQKDEGEDEHA